MNALVSQEMMHETLTLARLSAERAIPGPEALASPSYRALESQSVFVADKFVKRMHPEVIDGFDLAAAMQLATQAGECRVGPRVYWSSVETGAIAMEALKVEWKTATQADLQVKPHVENIVAAIRKLHSTSPLNGRFNAFQKIDDFIQRFKAANVALPDDIGWIRRLLGQAEFLADSGTLSPCRNDGSASNILIRSNGDIRLVDYDRAGMNDPFYDLGCLMSEVTDFEQEMKFLYTAYCGEFDEAGFSRARLWSYVDDLMHALWARFLSFSSARHSIEWLKYSEWRLLRLRMSLSHPNYADKLGLAREAS